MHEIAGTGTRDDRHQGHHRLGFFWVWLDALFISMFFVRPKVEGFMTGMATVSVCGLSLP